MKRTYDQIQKASKELGETNDCAVIAVSAVSNLPYEHVHQVFSECGRERKKGTFNFVTHAALRRLNLWYEQVDMAAKTVRTFERIAPSTGRFLLFTRTHILAVVNGEVIDWTKNRLHRITDIYEVSF